jgi:hypothetical protein
MPLVACRDQAAKDTCGGLWQQLIRPHPVDPQQCADRSSQFYSEWWQNGAPEEIRTPDPQIRSLFLTLFRSVRPHSVALLPSQQTIDQYNYFVV